MLAHADLHLVVRQLCQHRAGNWVSGAPHGHCQRRHIIRCILGNVCHFVQTLSGGGGSAGDLVNCHTAYKTAAIIRVGARFAGNILLRYDLANTESFLPGQLHCHVAGQHVTCVV